MTCPRFGKLIGGCKFSPRYDEVKPSGGNSDAFWAAAVGREHKPATPKRTYIRNVCERCGKTVERA